MKLYKLLIISLIIFLGSCNNKKSKQESIAIWEFNCMNDTIIQKNKLVKKDINSKFLISLLNKKYNKKVKLNYIMTSKDTLFVTIEDSTIITQQMGTCGAHAYLIESTFTLTELPNINYVNFNFEGGDHAVPGTYNRKYFLNKIKINKKINKK